MRHRETYEAIDPAEIGHPHGSEIVLGKLSGRAGFAARARQLGFTLTGAPLQQAFTRFQALADQKREIDDTDIARLCSHVTGPEAEPAA